jgi:cyclohexadienyl dehydratase
MTLPDFIGQGQADALLTDSLEAPHFLSAHPQLHGLPPIGRDRKAYVLRREDQELHEWVNTWLIKREADGFLKNARTRWLGQGVGQPPFPPMAAVFALMDVRLAMMPAVAAYKRDHQLPIEDLQQEARVLEKIATLATQNALDPAALQALFRVQINMAKQVQRGVLQGQPTIPTWAHGRNLRQELRPTLAQLSKRIVQELARLAPLIPDRDKIKIVIAAQQEITPASILAATKRQLGEALWEGMKQSGTKER